MNPKPERGSYGIFGISDPREETMKFIPKHVIRIEPAFEDRDAILRMFARHAPYRAIGAYIPDVVVDATKPEAEQFVQPWFRGNWAAGGEPLVEGAEAILQNKQFLEAAKTPFRNVERVSRICRGQCQCAYACRYHPC
jgi:hypothetical protein